MPSPDGSWYLCHLIVKVNPHFQVLLIYTNLSSLLVSPRLPQPLLLSPLPMVNIVHIHHHFLSLFSFSTGFLSISNFRLALKKEKKTEKRKTTEKSKTRKRNDFCFFSFLLSHFHPINAYVNTPGVSEKKKKFFLKFILLLFFSAFSIFFFYKFKTKKIFFFLNMEEKKKKLLSLKGN